MTTRRRASLRLLAGLAALVLVVAAGVAAVVKHRSSTRSGASLASNPYLDPGTPLSGVAPDFALTDQFGRRVSLSDYRGKAVILAFNDSECTTICPLTTSAMVEAKGLLGAAGADVALLGIDANPQATAISDVRGYSIAHGMLHQWRFLTAPLPRLKAVWKAYHIQAAIEAGQVDHTPALYVIDPRGRLRWLFMTQMSYAAVGQLGHMLAQDVASLLPGRPQVHSAQSYGAIPPIGPTSAVTLPGGSGGTVALGPGRSPHLLFFSTWAQQTTPLRAQLAALQRYQNDAAAARLPPAVAVDEASVEPSPSPLPSFLAGLKHRLTVPVAVDRSGRVADGYEVQDEPWFVLVSSTGKFLWYYDVSTAGAISTAELERKVRSALERAPRVTTSASSAADAALNGSPRPLASVHAESNQLLGGIGALKSRLRSLRGYPVVLNIWGSWCGPCQAEFPLFAAAGLAYGRRVAFLGLDVNDFPGPAKTFLATHPVSYPSYQSAAAGVGPVLPQGLIGTPTTVYFTSTGRIAYVHTGQYESQGSLNGDIQQYALGG